MDRLARILTGHHTVGLDTPIFIYHVERHPDYLPYTQQILSLVAEGQLAAVTSVVTLMEMVVHPLRMRRPDIADEYEILLLNFPNLTTQGITPAVARRAAALRARYNIRPADALQAAACGEAGATLFITNDRRLHMGPALPVLCLNDLR